MRIGLFRYAGESAHVIAQDAVIFHVFDSEPVQVIHRFDKVEILVVIGIKIPRLRA